MPREKKIKVIGRKKKAHLVTPIEKNHEIRN